MDRSLARALHEKTVTTMGPRSRRNSRGFTLIEMMAVVMITAILALLATLSYRKFVTSARVTEAIGMVGNIRAAQEAFRSETLQYLDVSNAGATSFAEAHWYPSAGGTFTAGASRTAWGAPSTTGAGGSGENARWMQLAVKTDGPVVFDYQTKAGPAGTTPATSSLNPAISGYPTFAASPDPWYVVVAGADLDSNGKRCYVLGSSFTGEMYVENEGE